MEQKVKARINCGNDDKGKCSVCSGIGWTPHIEYKEEYGQNFELWSPCPKCYGINSNDITGTPLHMHDADLSRFDFTAYTVNIDKIRKIVFSLFEDWKMWQAAGRGIYLWSKTCGSGKTFLSVALAKSVMTKYNLRMRFITAPDYVQAVGDSYKRERGERDETQIYRECDLLVLDDIGAQIGRDWQQQELFKLINQRNSNGLITIYTSNSAPENLNVDDRTKSRIMDKSIVILMPEESIRNRKAKEKQNEFLKELGIA